MGEKRKGMEEPEGNLEILMVLKQMFSNPTSSLHVSSANQFLSLLVII